MSWHLEVAGAGLNRQMLDTTRRPKRPESQATAVRSQAKQHQISDGVSHCVLRHALHRAHIERMGASPCDRIEFVVRTDTLSAKALQTSYL